MKMIQAESKEKKSHLERLLGLGTVMVFLDSRKTNVDVPSAHRGLPQLALNFSYNFSNSDFKIAEDHLESTLTFPDGKYFCIVPMKALYGMTSRFAGETIVFPEDMPPEILEKMVQPEPSQGPALIASAPPPPPAAETAPDKKTPTPRKKGHLKLVKS